ncbi:GNAT family N-acetyltransferase [Shewanella electrodiphila]|uniref:GNAT family N-acetyltransferase n=1 Tax=Shewanella electrodiphila TaxID=934143 RepID=A0ABT0KMU8_9GAMM|nr:GNAT family N-acetyltransferase [Shewanella electrodiphila]MCL1045163.1 GNAT family N-acetyltransferase [Shewanella electrodiphila]
MNILIKPIVAEQDSEVALIIKTVGKEFGAIGEGFGPSDPEVEQMSQHYHYNNKSIYLVASLDGKILGCGGVASFNESEDTCELRKLFLLPESRGLGIGMQLTQACLEFAEDMGFKQCYLDTLTSMTAAIKLYEKVGFEHLNQPLDGTIHGGCDVWMLKKFSTDSGC